MLPYLSHRLNDLLLQDLHAEAARDRLVAQARPTRAGAGVTLARYLMAVVAAVAFVVGTR